jgi:hypothetical protein
VINEGAFRASNAELSYIGEDRASAAGALFSTVNPGHTLGDVANHAVEANGKLYVVVNNSRKIEVIETGTHRWLQTISLSRWPRMIEVVSQTKAYVTNHDSTVSIIDLERGVVRGDVVVGEWPEGLIKSGDRLYVLNGNFGYGSTISVIDLAGDTVRATITTPPGPSYAVHGRTGRIHVSCTGYVDYMNPARFVPGSILTIDAVTGAVIDTVYLTEPGGKIAADASGHVYVLGNGTAAGRVWKLSGSDGLSVQTSALVAGRYYGIGVDAGRSELYLASAGDFVGNGSVQVHSLDGSLLRTYTSGIGVAPNGFVVLP